MPARIAHGALDETHGPVCAPAIHSRPVLAVCMGSKMVRVLLAVVVLVWPMAGVTALSDGYAAAQRGDYETVYREWLPLAEAGDAGAQYIVGMFYQLGKGNPKDYREAENWYRMAAEQGYTNAQVALAVMYTLGEEVAQDFREAARWLGMAAEQGNPVAQTMLATMYYEGTGIRKDKQEMVKWFRKAAEQGDADAQFALGVLYAKDEDVQQDLIQSLAWLNLSAAQGHERAVETRLKFNDLMTSSQIAEARQLSDLWLNQIELGEPLSEVKSP